MISTAGSGGYNVRGGCPRSGRHAACWAGMLHPAVPIITLPIRVPNAASARARRPARDRPRGLSGAAPRRRGDGEALWIERRDHLAPGKRHGDRRVGSGPWRPGRDRRRAAIIPEIVEEDPADPRLLAQRRGEAVPGIGRDHLAQRPAEGLRLRPARLGAERRHHMQPLATGGLAEGGEAQPLQPLPHLLRGRDHPGEGQVLGRVEVKDEPVGSARYPLPGHPRGGSPSPPSGPAQPAPHRVDGEVGRTLASHRHLPDQVGRPGMACRWKKRSAPMPSGVRSNETGRPATCGSRRGATAS